MSVTSTDTDYNSKYMHSSALCIGLPTYHKAENGQCTSLAESATSLSTWIRNVRINGVSFNWKTQKPNRGSHSENRPKKDRSIGLRSETGTPAESNRPPL